MPAGRHACRSPRVPLRRGSSPTWTPARCWPGATERPHRTREHHQDAAGADRARRAARPGRHGRRPPRPTPRSSATAPESTPGRTYTARQLLDALLLVSGNDAANTLADMLGGYDTAVAKMNAKAALARRATAPTRLPRRARRPGRLRVHHAARPGGHLPCRDGQPGVRPDHRAADRDVPDQDAATRRWSTRTNCCTAIPARSAARPVSPTPAKKTFVARRRPRRPATGDRDDVRPGQGGRPDLLGSGRRPAGLGLRPGPAGERRHALAGVDIEKLLNRNGSETSSRERVRRYAQRPCESCWPRWPSR